MPNKIALVDMDGVLADWLTGLRSILEILCTQRNMCYPLPSIQESWELLTGNQETDDLITLGLNHSNLYSSLPVIPGAKKGLETLESLGFDIFICSTPAPSNENCASQKYTWIQENLGEKFVEKTILTTDKTLVRGDILIDDKPEIFGVCSPSWEHIVFDAPYNQKTQGKRMFGWYNTKTVTTSVSIAVSVGHVAVT